MDALLIILTALPMCLTFYLESPLHEMVSGVLQRRAAASLPPPLKEEPSDQALDQSSTPAPTTEPGAASPNSIAKVSPMEARLQRARKANASQRRGVAMWNAHIEAAQASPTVALKVALPMPPSILPDEAQSREDAFSFL